MKEGQVVTRPLGEKGRPRPMQDRPKRPQELQKMAPRGLRMGLRMHPPYEEPYDEVFRPRTPQNGDFDDDWVPDFSTESE